MQDPYLLLGYGMNAYFQVMINLMCLMIIASCFAIPLMMRFADYSAFQNQGGNHIYSLGNMGGSDALCEVAPLMDEHSSIHF